MNVRLLFVLKMISLVCEEDISTRGVTLTREKLISLACQYGKSASVAEAEVEDALL